MYGVCVVVCVTCGLWLWGGSAWNVRYYVASTSLSKGSTTLQQHCRLVTKSSTQVLGATYLNCIRR